MTADPGPDDLLASIGDGRAADWAAAERAAGADPARLEVLKGVAKIAEFHRERQRAAGDPSGPERWGDLVLLECLGTGGRGEVWRAWDPSLERDVALKLMHAGLDDAALLAEARHLARVRHPHVVTVLGVDEREGRVGMWMELIRGWTLEQAVRAQGPLAAADVQRLGLEIGAALAAVHATGLLHRDLKPANVMRDLEGRFVLADFGLGLRHDLPAAALASASGTPMYMAPERLAGQPASESADLYSLGMLMWFALAGRHPFDAKSLADLARTAREGPESLRRLRPEVPPALAAIVERAIAPDPARRFAGVRAMTAALESQRPSARVPLSLAFALGALIVTAIVVNRAPAPHHAPASATPPAAAVSEGYSVAATFLRHDGAHVLPLASGDRVRPGDHVSLEVRASRPAWIYVLDEDERGERYLLFPQPRFDAHNPIRGDSSRVLPGTVDGKEYAWTVTSAGGREYLLVVASPAPVAEIEADLQRLPRSQPGRPIAYAPVGPAAVERLRGIGGLDPVTGSLSAPTPSRGFDRFVALAGRETDVHGIWVRRIVLENPSR